MSHHRRVVSALIFAVVVAMTGALVLLLGSTAQGFTRPHGTSSKRRALTPLATLIATDPSYNGNFGWSVAVSGSTAVVGAPYANSSTGAAYVFTKVKGTWTQQAELLASDAATDSGDDFGWSVAISGNTVAIGAPDHSNELGAAYVFTRTGGTWTQQAEFLDPESGAISNIKFGYSVVTSGSTVMVGADGAYGSGAVYVYSDSAGPWSQEAELTAPDAALSDDFGWSMALSHSTLVVSAVKHAKNGAIYVFTDLGGTWTYRTELTASDGATNDYFGDKVATNGSRIVAGAPGHVLEQGAAYVFDGSGAKWTQVAELTASDGGPNDCFGWAIGLSGKTVLVGAEQTFSDSGAAYVFQQKGAKWTQRHELTPTDGGTTDKFGYSVSLSGTTGIVGANQAEDEDGSAYLYKL
jgi:hypothetical protein